MATRIVIAEDNLLVREGVRQLLALGGEFAIVGLCAEADSVVDTVERERAEVLVTDVRMPPGQSDEGIQLANRLREAHPEVGVVVLSHHADPAYALALLEHGSQRRAYLLKERIHRADELRDAVAVVAGGGSVIDPVVVESLVAAARRNGSPLANLTRRELEILDLMAQGKSNAGIAARLCLTVHSVEKYVSSILAKLGLGGDTDLHRRVQAVLVYLAESTAPAPAGRS